MEFEDVEVNSKKWLALEDLLNEEWRDVKGYEGMYQVSNYGRVKSFIVDKGNRIKIIKFVSDKDGYGKVSLHNKGKTYSISVHRLEAQTFLPNPNNYPVVNHINGVKFDNRINNLEWCTIQYNTKESYRMGLQKPPHLGKFGGKHPASKAIYQIDKENNKIIKKWGSAAEIGRELNFKSSASITACCRKNRYKSAYGYKWRYADERNSTS